MAPLDNSCSAIEIVEWPRPKICIGIDKTLLDNVQRALEAPIEIVDDGNEATTQQQNTVSNKRPSRTQRNRVQPAKKPRVTFAETNSSTRTTNATNNSNRTSPVTNHQQRPNNFLQWHIIEVGKVQHAHQNGPPRMPGGVDEYAGRKTVKQWLDAEKKYKKDVKKIKVPVYKDADRLIARPGAVEANINLTRVRNQCGAPINKLHDQLLIEIFKRCSHIQTLSTVVTVCHQWRRLGLDPIVWRHVSAEQRSLDEQIRLCDEDNRRPLARRLQHTISITLDSIIYAQCVVRRLPKNPRRFFRRLKQVYGTWLYYEDLLRFITWIPDLEVIWAERLKVMSRHQQMFIFSCFGKHQKTLKKLSLRFSEGCPVEGYIRESRDSPNVLPSTLEVLELVNIYDPDEEDHMKHLRRVQEKITMDEQRSGYNQLQRSLDTKYQSIGQLSNLRSFTFGRCNAWTADTWRKCLLPCAPKLKFLSLAGWDSRGRIQDTPDERLKAREELLGTPPVSLAERAIADSIALMSKIRQIQLVKFYIGHGVVQGVKQLLHNNPDLEIEVVYVNGKKARNGMARLEGLEGTSTDLDIYFIESM